MGLREDLEACIAADAAGEDPRDCFWRLRATPDGMRLETTDAAFATRRIPVLGARFPGVPLEVVPLAPWPGRCAWVTSSVADVRKQPAHQAEQTTQALQGDALLPLVHEDGWLLARLPDGYFGWVRDWHLTLVPSSTVHDFAARTDARAALPLLRLHEAPAPESAVRGESLLGTPVVRRQSQSGWVEIELPGGICGWVRTDGVRAGAVPWPATPPAVVATLCAFIGVPYVWGGKSPKGFDCSGLVQFGFGLHGVALPRDSDQQFACGTDVAAIASGDLLFFGRERITHVGVALDTHRFVHARGTVRQNSLSPEDPHHAPDLAAMLRGVRRVLPQVA